MKKETYDLIDRNYVELFNTYCKYQDCSKIKNGRSCEDVFNDKILYFIELNIEPTLDNLNKIIKGCRKDRQLIVTIKYTESIEDIKVEETIEFKMKMLFIDYRPEK